MKKGILILALILLAACQHETKVSVSRDTTNSIVYMKDSRTGLCFATMGSMSYGGYVSISIANVPCSPEVMRLVQGQ